MKKQLTILFILIFVFGLFSFKSFVSYSYAACPILNDENRFLPGSTNLVPNITDECQYPKIISISPMTVRIGQNFEVIGENLDNTLFIAAGGGRMDFSATSFGETVSWTSNKILAKLVQGDVGASYSVRLSFINKSGGAEVAASPFFTVKEECVWSCGEWNACSQLNTKTRTCVKPDGCESLNSPMPLTTEKCDYVPFCTSDHFSCGNWSSCSWFGSQTRLCTNMTQCKGNYSPSTIQSCTYVPPCYADTWKCGDWTTCSSNGLKTRVCNKTDDCPSVDTPPPSTSQSCNYTPACSADTWQCGNWGTCSPQGIQARSCNKTYDCPSVETAAPATSQYCEAPNQPKQQTPSEDLGISNQDTIIKATVKLVCPVSSTMASQGSGTIINSSGLILTNKHVIDGTSGCLVGFIDDYDDEPYFGDRQIADIYKISSDADVAVLKLRNPKNNNLASINISQNNSSNIKLGEILTTYGYPAMFGKKITYTSGDFSGVDGNYLKTTAVIEHGNSGGGAYLKNGTFIGIPTAVVKGSLNSMGYLLSVNKVNSWLNNSVAYNYNNNNNSYSRVSALLENIDLGTLNSLGLFVPGDNVSTNIDKKLSNRLKGKLLLQVEDRGRIWYVNPDDAQKHEVTFANALPLFQKFALGITNKDLESVPQNNETRTSLIGNRLKGKLLLQVEDKGRIWYVDFNGKRWEVTWANLMELFQKLALGITNADLSKISVGSLE